MLNIIGDVMKKSSLISIVLSGFILSSCGASEEALSEHQNEQNEIILARITESHDFLYTLIDNYNSEGDVQVNLKEYPSSEQLTMAILGGESIDIVYSGNKLNVSPLVSKGFFIDLSQYINEEEYVHSVIDAMKQDGKLYELPYDFDVESAIAKYDLWGEDTDSSFSHIAEKSANLGCRIPFDFTMNSYGFVSFVKSEFVDLESHTCSFNSKEFEEFIMFMKEYYSSVKNLSNEQLYNEFKNDNMLMLATGFSSFDQLDYLEKDIGEKVIFVGFPSDQNNYHIAVPRSTFSVAKNSLNKDKAVDFVKYCVSYDAYITKNPDGSELIAHSFSLPININALECCYHLSIESNSNDIDETILVSNREQLLSQINSVSAVARLSDDNIKDIISNELSAYFNDDKDAKTVCENIQSRCMLLLWEQYE